MKKISEDALRAHFEFLLEDSTLEELLELCNLDTVEALLILFSAGHLDLPDILTLEEGAVDDGLG